MDDSKFFKAWNNFLRLFPAANIQSQNNNAPPENPEAPQDEAEQPEAPVDSEVVSGDENDKHSKVGSSDNHSNADLPDDTNAPEPNNARRSNPIPTSNSDTAAGLSLFCRRAFDSVASRVGMALSQIKDHISSAFQTFKEKGILNVAKELGNWIKSHPKETTLIVLPLVIMTITAIALSATGFGPAGVVAGSTAAFIQAGIGNVVAHSVFAVCTSAMMGGYGAPIIFGGAWLLTTVATVATMFAWNRWNNRNDRRLVLLPRASPKDISKKVKDAAENLVIGSMLITAYVSYLIKSWLQSRRGPKRD